MLIFLTTKNIIAQDTVSPKFTFQLNTGGQAIQSHYGKYIDYFRTKYDTVKRTFKFSPVLGFRVNYYTSKIKLSIGNFDNIQWSNGANTPQITISNGGNYTATASNTCGRVSKTIQVDTCDRNYSIFIPNAFTPNGDYINDELKVYGKNIQLITFAIYNRWGEKLFETNDINTGWEGIFINEPLPADTYIYMVEYTTPSVQDILKAKGDVLLLR